ncbi:hypothetical protein SUGI_0257500 [Cryptomeria japonica]|nr:hypothetical protein SUGI_0257500 [Cryptomeria japonica]
MTVGLNPFDTQGKREHFPTPHLFFGFNRVTQAAIQLHGLLEVTLLFQRTLAMGKLFQSLYFAVTVFIQLKSNGAAVEAGDTLSLGASLTGNQTIISNNGTFELGFFSPNGSNWYIGICEGNLVLFDAEGSSIWSVNTTDKASRAVILDSGIFLMLRDGNKSQTVWQSFDNLLDTWLPGMTFGGQQKPGDTCAVYGTGGAYGICDSKNLQLCSGGESFIPIDNRAWASRDWASSGCVRESPLNCSSDEFIDLGVTLPDDYASSYPASSTKDCQEACLRNYSCTAFRFIPLSGPCQIWSGDLLNMCNSTPSTSN